MLGTVFVSADLLTQVAGTDWSRTGVGLESDWSRTGVGLESDWSRTGVGLESDWSRTFL